jgi:hypothetical protein
MSNNEERIVDGRYLEKSELEKRLKLMGINFVEHILKTKWDYASVYNSYVHNPAYQRKIKALLKNDHYSDLVSRKSTAKKKVIKVELSDDESSFTENVNISNLGKKRNATTSKKSSSNIKENNKKKVLRNKSNLDTENNSEIDLVGETSIKSNSKSRNKSSTPLSISKKKDDKKIYNVLFPNSNNSLNLNEKERSKSKSKESIFSRKYDSMVSQLIKITNKASAENKSTNSNKKKQNVKYNINNVNESKTFDPPIIKEQKIRTNQKNNTVISQASNVYSNELPITNQINSQHINVICNVNPKVNNEFTLGKPKIKRNVFSSSGKGQDATVKNLNNSVVVDTDVVIKTNTSPNSNAKYLEENIKLYNQLGLENINIRQETPFRYSSENKSPTVKKPNINSSNNKFNTFVTVASSSKQVGNFKHENEDKVTNNLEISKHNQLSKIERLINFMNKDIFCIEGINLTFLLKSGLSIAIIGYLCYILSNPDKYSSTFNQIKEYLTSFGLNNLNSFSICVIALISFLLYCFVISLKRYKSSQLATSDYNNLLEISSEQEFPEEEDFKVSESNIIKRMAERTNTTREAYECNIYPFLKEIIEEDDCFYFETEGDDVYLKLIPGARQAKYETHYEDEKAEVAEFECVEEDLELDN